MHIAWGQETLRDGPSLMTGVPENCLALFMVN